MTFLPPKMKILDNSKQREKRPLDDPESSPKPKRVLRERTGKVNYKEFDEQMDINVVGPHRRIWRW